MKLGRIRPALRKPAPKKPTPVKPTPSPGLPRSPDRGNVEQNYRGIPGLVNATAPVLRKRPNPGTGIPPFSPPAGSVGNTGFKPNMPMVPSKLPAPRTNVTTGSSSKVAGASTSKPMLKRIGSVANTVAKSMMKKGGAVKKAKPRGKK